MNQVKAKAGDVIRGTQPAIGRIPRIQIATTSNVEFNEFHKKYYVNGFKLIESQNRYSKMERRWCLTSYEVLS
jgi:hypothetical protein